MVCWRSYYCTHTMCTPTLYHTGASTCEHRHFRRPDAYGERQCSNTTGEITEAKVQLKHSKKRTLSWPNQQPSPSSPPRRRGRAGEGGGLPRGQGNASALGPPPPTKKKAGEESCCRGGGEAGQTRAGAKAWQAAAGGSKAGPARFPSEF
jgi:hypothetical protein